MNIGVRVNPELDKQVNADNISKTEAEIIAIWNAEHPSDQIPVE